MIRIELPYPPSINHYYRHVGNKVLISRKGKEYRQEVVSIVSRLGFKTLLGPLKMDIEIWPPDRRRRDVDNVQKALLDALEHGGIYGNDSQIHKLSIVKREPVSGGATVVRLGVWKG